MSGPFFTEGSYTKNTPEEVNAMMANLEEWSIGNRPTPEEVTVFSLHSFHSFIVFFEYFTSFLFFSFVFISSHFSSLKQSARIAALSLPLKVIRNMFILFGIYIASYSIYNPWRRQLSSQWTSNALWGNGMFWR